MFSWMGWISWVDNADTGSKLQTEEKSLGRQPLWPALRLTAPPRSSPLPGPPPLLQTAPSLEPLPSQEARCTRLARSTLRRVTGGWVKPAPTLVVSFFHGFEARAFSLLKSRIEPGCPEKPVSGPRGSGPGQHAGAVHPSGIRSRFRQLSVTQVTPQPCSRRGSTRRCSGCSRPCCAPSGSCCRQSAFQGPQLF